MSGLWAARRSTSYGNLNSSLIGDAGRPTTRLPGTGGGNDIASLTQMIVAMKHEKRRFVERVDFVTSPGFLTGGDSRREAGLVAGGMYRVVTDLGLLRLRGAVEADDSCWRCTPAPAWRRCRTNTGFELAVAADLPSPSRRPNASSRCCATSTPTASTPPELAVVSVAIQPSSANRATHGVRRRIAMTIFSNTFGLAMRNFTTCPQMPDPQALIDYARQGRGAGLRLALGVGPHPARGRPAVPGHRLADPAERGGGAHRQDQARHRGPGAAVAQPGGAGQGIVEPRPDLPGAGCCSAWPRAGTSANSTRSACRSTSAAGSWTATSKSCAGCGPRTRSTPNTRRTCCAARTCRQSRARLPPILIGGYVDRVLKRAALNGGWLTYFYTPDGFAQSWAKVCALRQRSRQGPGEPAQRQPIGGLCRQLARGGRAGDAGMARPGVGLRRLEPIDQDSAVIGTVDECVAQLRAQLAVGVQKLIFVPVPLSARAGRDHRPRHHPPPAGLA